MDWKKVLRETKQELDQVSPSFCLAKWLQVTLHLQNGFNHSCHHPKPHKIPLDELKKNPSALHNTAYKKQLREMMLQGKRPLECSYCWKVEDAPGNHSSDRIIKSSDPWARPKLQQIAKLPPLEDVNPTYLEVSFGHECNFRCAYCLPQISSSLWNEYAKHGPYVDLYSLEELTQRGMKPYGPNEENPYVEAFWKWFPKAAPDLQVFRITGGEPLINPNTFRVLEYLEANPQPQLELCINSNLGIPRKNFDTFIEKVNRLSEAKKVRKFTLYTSIDTYGRQAEYIRFGLSYESWRANVLRYLAETAWPITHMVTFNALSPASFDLLLEDLKAITPADPEKRMTLDISHLVFPEFLSATILPEKWRRKIEGSLELMEKFSDYERNKLRRVKTWVDQTPSDSQLAQHNRARFFQFTTQYDQRKNASFLDYFPEMEDFYLDCKAAAQALLLPL